MFFVKNKVIKKQKKSKRLTLSIEKHGGYVMRTDKNAEPPVCARIATYYNSKLVKNEP